jgi:hypothetical protein
MSILHACKAGLEGRKTFRESKKQTRKPCPAAASHIAGTRLYLSATRTVSVVGLKYSKAQASTKQDQSA